VRINAVLPGLLMTKWVGDCRICLSSLSTDKEEGMRYSPDMVKMMKEKAALKIETDLNDCANAFVMIAKNASMTAQKIQVCELAENSVMSRAVANS
jgi:hypothetical protein